MQAQLNQAISFHKSGNFPQAEALYRRILESQPEAAPVQAQLAILLSQTQRDQQALPLFAKAIEALPDAFDLLMQAADVASRSGETGFAEKCLRRAVALRDDDIRANEALAGVLIGNHREKEALNAAKHCIKLNPKSANAYNVKGMALCRMGEIDKGYKNFQKALKLNPGQLGVIRNLILYGKQRREPLLAQVIPQLEGNLSQPGLQAMVKMNIAYVLSMYFEKEKQPGKSFRYLKMGNDINRSGYQYSHAQSQKQFGLMSKIFDMTLADALQDNGLNDEGPIFILGMPRSGTTLIEQILSSHSKVESEGEIQDLRLAFEAQSKRILDEQDVTRRAEACLLAAKDYLKSVRARQNAPFFTDKMPYNFLMIGLIALTMPNARIIHCTRDPLETCFSIYKQNFSGSHAYTNDLVELGEYYNAYESLMEVWKQRFGDRIYEANYERMIDNSEQEIRSLLSFCELPMEENCLSFHKNKRAVRTASVAQVRQPIYKDALKASTPYETQLTPLKEVLDSGRGAELIYD